ncbi:hypothetical protein HDK77DRAFT_485440 [Phyllosticta capitalensis]
MAISFFRDRPARVMSWIKSIKVIVGNVADSLFDIFDDRDDEELRADTLLFTYLLKFRLTALKHLSLIFYGWPPDFRKGEYQEEDLRGEVAKTSPAGILLLLPKYRRLSVEVRSYPSTSVRTLADPKCPFLGTRRNPEIPLMGTPMDPALPLAFAALVRSYLLRGGERLEAANIVVHSRHWLNYAFPENASPDEAVYIRQNRSLFVVRCDDDEFGRSFLEPVHHPPRLWTRKIPWPELEGPGPYPFGLCWGSSYGTLYFPAMLRTDYARDDGGDNDSLHELDLSGQNLETVAPADLRAVLTRNL